VDSHPRVNIDDSLPLSLHFSLCFPKFVFKRYFFLKDAFFKKILFLKDALKERNF